jgi:hypothetical protein
VISSSYWLKLKAGLLGQLRAKSMSREFGTRKKQIEIKAGGSHQLDFAFVPT